MTDDIKTRGLGVVDFEGFDSTWLDLGDSKEDAIASVGGIGRDKPIPDVCLEPIIASRAVGLEHPRDRAIPNEGTDEIMIRVHPYVTGGGTNNGESWVWHRWGEYADHPTLLRPDCIPLGPATSAG